MVDNKAGACRQAETGSREPSPKGLGPTGFDPARGDGANEEIVALVRVYASEIFGGNCAFADDDLRLMAGMARRAVAMFDDLDESVRRNIDRLKGRGRWADIPGAASAIEAAIAAKTAQTGLAEGESAVAKPDAQPPSGDPQ